MSKKKILKISKWILIVLTALSCCFLISRMKTLSILYSIFPKKMEVVSIPQGTLMFIRGIGQQVISAEEGAMLKEGDVIFAVNSTTLYCDDDINETLLDEEKIMVSCIRDNQVFDMEVKKEELINAQFYNYKTVEAGAIAMIEPKTNRFASNARKKETIPLKNFTSGYITNLDYSILYDFEEIRMSSNGDVIGSLTDYGEKAMYGYAEPKNYEKEYLVEIEHKRRVKDGLAVIEVCDSRQEIILVEVLLKCEKDQVVVTLSEKSYIDTIAKIGVPGLPIFQNGKMVAVLAGKLDEEKAYAWYASDVYDEMMSTAK